MINRVINKENGEILVDGEFIISRQTELQTLIARFGKEIKQSEFNSRCYILSQRKIGNHYLKFYFFFESKHLKKIEFEIETEPVERIPWSSNRDLETNWIAQQMDDASNFVWDMKKAGRQYHLQYDWGSIGVYYDFKNGTFDSKLIYY